MAFTGHGHFVPGSSRKPWMEPSPEIMVKCGGPGVCAECTADCIKITGVPVHGDIYPAYVMQDSEEQLIGIARLVEGRIFVIEDSPSVKSGNYDNMTEQDVISLSEGEFQEWLRLHTTLGHITKEIKSAIIEKRNNANQEGSDSEDRGSTGDHVAYDVRSRQLGFGR